MKSRRPNTFALLKTKLLSSRVAASTGALVISRLVVSVLSWTATVLIARTLTQDQFGAYSLAFGLLGLLSIFTDLGVGRVAVTALSENGANHGTFLGQYVLLRALLGLIAAILAVVIVVAGRYSHTVINATIIVALAAIVASASHGYVALFQARMAMTKIATFAVVAQVLQTAITIVLVRYSTSVTLLAAPAIVYELVRIFLIRRAAQRLVSIHYAVNVRVWGRMLREAAPIAVGLIMASLYYRVDLLMLSAFDDLDSVGVYSVAYKFVDLLHFVPSSLTLVLLPRLVQFGNADHTALRSLVRRAAASLLLVGFLAMTCFVLFAEDVISALYGSGYRAAGDTVVMLITAEVISFLGQLAVITLVAFGHHRIYVFAVLGGLLANVLLNLIAIPTWSYEGAAGVTIVTELLVTVMVILGIRRSMHVNVVPIAALFTALASASVGLLAGLATNKTMPWWVAASVTVVAYLFCSSLIEIRMRRGGSTVF